MAEAGGAVSKSAVVAAFTGRIFQNCGRRGRAYAGAIYLNVVEPLRAAWQAGSVEIGQFIVKTPGTCGGRARLSEKRVPVSSIYRWFLQGCDPEDILEKFDGVVLAEIYAAISYALANLDEITGEIESEDRISSQSSRINRAEPARSSE